MASSRKRRVASRVSTRLPAQTETPPARWRFEGSHYRSALPWRALTGHDSQATQGSKMLKGVGIRCSEVARPGATILPRAGRVEGQQSSASPTTLTGSKRPSWPFNIHRETVDQGSNHKSGYVSYFVLYLCLKSTLPIFTFCEPFRFLKMTFT